LHHAFKTGGCLELVAGLVCILRIHKLRDDTLSALQVCHVLWELEDQGVSVAWEVRVALFIGDVAIFVPFGLEQGIKLVVLDVDHDLLRRVGLVDKSAYRTHGLARESGHSYGVHFPVILSRNTQHGGQSLESEGIGILEEDHPLFPLFEPFLCNSKLIQEGVNVTMTVWLGDDFEFTSLSESHVAVVVQ